LVERWRDMRLEGSKLDGVADAGTLDEGRELGLFEDMVQGSDLGCEGTDAKAPQTNSVLLTPGVAVARAGRRRNFFCKRKFTRGLEAGETAYWAVLPKKIFSKLRQF
jgi:hypothetical protein